MLRAGAEAYVSDIVKSYNLLNAEYVDYYFTASDGTNTVSTVETEGRPYRLQFSRGPSCPECGRRRVAAGNPDTEGVRGHGRHFESVG